MKDKSIDHLAQNLLVPFLFFGSAELTDHDR